MNVRASSEAGWSSSNGPEFVSFNIPLDEGFNLFMGRLHCVSFVVLTVKSIQVITLLLF